MVGLSLPRILWSAALIDYATAPTLKGVISDASEKGGEPMRRYSYAAGALLGGLLTALVVVVIAAGTDEIPRVVSVWPLLAALGTSVATWWLQGLIYALLARPQLKGLRVGNMFRIDMAGLFVALVSPIRGAELPYKAFLMKRLGLSGGEGSNVVLTRVLLDVAVLTPAALCGLVLTSKLPEAHGPNLVLVGLSTTVTLAAVVYLMLRRVWMRPESTPSRLSGSAWQEKGRAKISAFFAGMHRSFASYWRRGHRTTLVWAVALAVVYWALRLCAGPLALMAVGWSGSWVPVVVAQLFLASFVLPLVPTPGGSGARELGLAVLLSPHVPQEQLLSGIIVYTGLTHWLPVIVAAFFAGHQSIPSLARPRTPTVL
jgi:glycosyltransferase 2 family protein